MREGGLKSLPSHKSTHTEREEDFKLGADNRDRRILGPQEEAAASGYSSHVEIRPVMGFDEVKGNTGLDTGALRRYSEEVSGRRGGCQRRQCWRNVVNERAL